MCVLVRSLSSCRFRLGARYGGVVSFGFVGLYGKAKLLGSIRVFRVFAFWGARKTRGDGKCVLSFLREATERLLRD